MKVATRVASGTKPNDLASAVPGIDEANSSQSGMAHELESLQKPQNRNVAQSQGSDDAALIALANEVPQEPEYPADTRQQPNLNLDDPRATLANVVEQGLPSAVSLAGIGAGAAAGTAAGGPGIGTGAGAEAGNAAAATLNVALAPYYKQIGNKIRESLGIPKDQEDAAQERINAFIAETIGVALPRFLAQNGYVQDYVGARLAKTAGPQVAKNIEAMNAAKDSGIDLGPRGLFKDTVYGSQIENDLKGGMSGQYGRGFHDQQFLDQQKNLDNVTKSFNRMKESVGSQVDSAGNPIIRADNVEKRKEMIGKQIGDLNRKAVEVSGDKMIDPVPIIAEMKDQLEINGIKTDNGVIPAEVINELDNDAKALARQWNSFISKVNEVQIQNGSTLAAEQLKYLRKGKDVTPNFNGEKVSSSSAQVQEGFPAYGGQTMNPGAPMEVLGSSSPLGVGSNTIPGESVQGSLGLAEQADYLNQVVSTGKNGKPITRAQVIAKTANQPIFDSEGIVNRGISLSELQRYTDVFQKLAEHDSFNRALKQKQFGSIGFVARDLRDNVTREAFQEAADKAAAAGDAGLARRFSKAADQLENLNKSYGQHADAQRDFFKSINDDPKMATENLVRKLGQEEYDNMLQVLSEKEKGALKNSYIENLVNEASENGVISDPSKVLNTLKKDGSRVKQLFGQKDYDALTELAGFAKTAEKIDSKMNSSRAIDGIANKIIKTINKFSGGYGYDFFENLFFRSPNIRNVVKETPAYAAAFNKYHGGAKVSDSPALVGGVVASSLAPKAYQAKKQASEDTRSSAKRDSELRAIDLDFE